MTGWGGLSGEARERHGRQRFHARDAEDGIQQRAILGAEAGDFGLQARVFALECAGRGKTVPKSAE